MSAVALVGALLVGVALGLLGGGGSILTVPLLVYVLGVDAKEAIATSLVVVGVTAAVAMLRHARAGNVAWGIALRFGLAGMVGAYGGGWVAGFLSGTTLLLLFAGMMLATGVAMLRPRPEPDEGEAPAHVRGGWRIVADGLVVGAVTGLVGAGGGFLVVPALVLLGGLPMRHAVGTSLLVIAMKSSAGWLGHASHVSMDVELTLTITAAAVVGSLLGAAVAERVPPRRLRQGFAVLVLVLAVVQLGMELPKLLG
ncbi:MAG: sulfite exporter TauE/SafE family protein [Alphaproteobacteria bacterium]|nr:sulfite exporter TauE/SafE family protein [Alphaproteobacteria bacterium]